MSLNNEQGFTYVDVLIGVLILLIGVMALAAAVTAAVTRTREGEQQLIARQFAASTLESIFSARDMSALGWDAIGNVGTNPVGGVNRGVFLTGQQQVRPNAGADGIVGTADDAGTFAAGATGRASNGKSQSPTTTTRNAVRSTASRL